MQHEFEFSAPLAFADIERLTGALCLLPGVRGVDVAPGSRQMHVEFDEAATSTRDITAALANAGYAEAHPERAGCCGGCCGG